MEEEKSTKNFNPKKSFDEADLYIRVVLNERIDLLEKKLKIAHEEIDDFRSGRNYYREKFQESQGSVSFFNPDTCAHCEHEFTAGDNPNVCGEGSLFECGKEPCKTWCIDKLYIVPWKKHPTKPGKKICHKCFNKLSF